jgi:hypothetical protein
MNQSIWNSTTVARHVEKIREECMMKRLHNTKALRKLVAQGFPCGGWR